MSVARLSDRVRRELTYLSYPSREWTVPRYRDGARVLDVLIVGGGQGGLATAFGLKLERITNIRIVDRNPRGLEGPWRRFARMKELRTIQGGDAASTSASRASPPVPGTRRNSVAKHGSAFEKFTPEVWRDYLDWYRDVLELPVENEIEVTSIEPAGDLLLAHLRRKGRIERVHARKIVLATGIEGSGGWRAPPALVADLPTERYAHSTDDIDFDRLAGKRVGVLGVGASALDNAAAALEAGAASVDLCFRRADIPSRQSTCLDALRGHARSLRRTDRPGSLAIHAPHSGGASRNLHLKIPFGVVAGSKISCGTPIAHGTRSATKETSR